MIVIFSDKLVIGVWIQLHLKNHLRGEGIARLLAFVIKSAGTREDIKIVIACTGWLEQYIRRYLTELDIKIDDKVEFLTSGKTPLIVKLYDFLENRKGKKKKKKKLNYNWSEMTVRFVKYLIKKASGIRSYFSALVLFFVFLPTLIILFAGVIAISIGKVFRIHTLISKLKRKLPDGGIYAKIKPVVHQNKFAKIIYHLYSNMLENEFEILAKKGRQRKDIDCWYVPHPGWSSSLELKKPLIVAVPDLVYLDFPTKFSDPFMKKIDEKAKNLIPNAFATICFSNYVKDNHVLKRFSVQPDRAFVIHHAPINTYEHIEKLSKRLKQPYKQIAGRIIKNHLRKIEKQNNHPLANYLGDFPLDEVPYIFASSQVRPHKNYLNLFKAYEILLRKKYKNIKLVITGVMDKELKEFVKERKLHLDILSIPQLPPKVHAAFYAKATLTVVPTLFEGGFPFVFSESLSVETPVVMSAIPVTEEVLEPELAKEMLFDPYDIRDMANRIEWALENRDQLLAKQLIAHEKMNERTWDKVGEEYIQVFEKVARGSRN